MNAPRPRPTANDTETHDELITFSVMDQMFGVPVLQVREVLQAPIIARVPLAPPEIAGSINLRGRIVTAVDVRRRLNLPPYSKTGMSVVVDCGNELYSLIIDHAGDVVSLARSDCERNPATLNPRWQEVASGIYTLKNSLLVILDIAKLLRLGGPANQV